MPQPSDYRITVITGSTAGVTGGEIVPPEGVMVIHDISYAEGIGTGQLVSIIAQPSGANIDAKNVAGGGNTIYGETESDSIFGTVERNNVLQVVTTYGAVIARVVYTIEYDRFA